MRQTFRLKHLNKSGKFPSGNARYYFRPKGQKGVPLPDLPPNHPIFLAKYAELAGAVPKQPAQTGSIAIGVEAFLASDEHLSRPASTRDFRRRIADKIREAYGTGLMKDLTTQHIRKDLAKFPPHPANNRLKVWRTLGRFWEDNGWVENDPAKNARPRATPATQGHVPWSMDDVAKFRNRWPVGSAQRLAMELIYWTGARIGDACTFGPGMIDGDGWLTYTQQKTGVLVSVPIRSDKPQYAGDCPDLLACISKAQHMVFMHTGKGRPRSKKAASRWLSKAATDAGLPKLSAHGLRKSRAVLLKENGATKDQRMAWLGHETEQESDHYSKSADRKKIISGTESSNAPNRVPTIEFKSRNNR